MKKESEKLVEWTLVGLLKEAGGMCIKLQADYQGGIPDRLCLSPDGRAAFVETKTTGEKPRPIQVQYHERLRSLNFRVEVIDTVEKAKAFVKDFVAKPDPKRIAAKADELERELALGQGPVKVNLQNVVYYSAYYQGALFAARALECYVNWDARGDGKVYRDAELALITQDKRSIEQFLSGCTIGYRNHQRDKKGKLVKCDAYFL